MGKTKGKKTVSAEDFIKAWVEGESIEAIAAALKLSKTSVYARAAKYRKAKIRLPERKSSGGRGRKLENRANELNTLIEKLTKGKR